MRTHLIAIALMAGVAMPAAAQRAENPEKRIERLEQELRAVQRKVFPAGTVSPEIANRQTVDAPTGVPATSAVADLNARLDAIEGQMRELTGLAEQNSNRMARMEETVGRLRDSMSARLDVLERSAPPAAVATVTPTPEPTPPPKAVPSTARRAAPRTGAAKPGAIPDWVSAADTGEAATGDAEAAYNAGFHLWEQKRYAEAQKALEKVAKDYPDHRFASWAANLAGRAYLDDGKPAAAARVLLANYQNNPKGERAADSLYFLGQALVALKKPADACKAYDELQDVYGPTMRAWLKQQLPAARGEARCR